MVDMVRQEVCDSWNVNLLQVATIGHRKSKRKAIFATFQYMNETSDAGG